MLRILGGGFVAFEQEGLDVETRLKLAKERSDLVVSIMGHRVCDPVMCRDSKIGGLTRQVDLLTAWK